MYENDQNNLQFRESNKVGQCMMCQGMFGVKVDDFSTSFSGPTTFVAHSWLDVLSSAST